MHFNVACLSTPARSRPGGAATGDTFTAAAREQIRFIQDRLLAVARWANGSGVDDNATEFLIQPYRSIETVGQFSGCAAHRDEIGQLGRLDGCEPHRLHLVKPVERLAAALLRAHSAQRDDLVEQAGNAGIANDRAEELPGPPRLLGAIDVERA